MITDSARKVGIVVSGVVRWREVGTDLGALKDGYEERTYVCIYNTEIGGAKGDNFLDT